MRLSRSTILLTAAATLLSGTLALAGGAAELDCPNACPLAKGANALRSNGAEGVRASAVVRHDVRREILTSLDRV